MKSKNLHKSYKMTNDIYVIVCNDAEWEDIAIYPDLFDAKLALLRCYKKSNEEPLGVWIEKFSKTEKESCYLPSYEKILINVDRVRRIDLGDIEEDYMPEEWFVSYTH